MIIFDGDDAGWQKCKRGEVGGGIIRKRVCGDKLKQ